jgi:hypothetical protein
MNDHLDAFWSLSQTREHRKGWPLFSDGRRKAHHVLHGDRFGRFWKDGGDARTGRTEEEMGFIYPQFRTWRCTALRAFHQRSSGSSLIRGEKIPHMRSTRRFSKLASSQQTYVGARTDLVAVRRRAHHFSSVRIFERFWSYTGDVIKGRKEE